MDKTYILMRLFEWDEAKRLSNIEKHSLDFARATLIFDGRPVLNFLAKTETEDRFVTVGRMDDGIYYTVIWTERIGAQRIISFRRARHGEKADYLALHG